MNIAHFLVENNCTDLAYLIAQVLLDGYIMVGIDGVEIGDGSDWFCYHASSHAILPVGYCESNNIPLTLPPGNVLNLLLQLFSCNKNQYLP